MPLRTANNPNTATAIMTTLKSILPSGTELAEMSESGTGVELVYLQAKYKMSLGMSADVPRAVNLTTGEQRYASEALRAYGGLIALEVGYYSLSDAEDDPDDVWAALDTDIERMKANLESNDDTHYGGLNHTISLNEIVLSPYEPAFDTTISGITLIKRTMTMTYTILPYGI